MFSKPAPKPAPSPVGQLIGLALIATLLFIGTHPTAPISQKVQDALGSTASAVTAAVGSSIPSIGSYRAHSAPSAPSVSYQHYVAADSEIVAYAVVDESDNSAMLSAYPDLNNSQVGGGK